MCMRAVSQAIASEQSLPTLTTIVNLVDTRLRSGDWIHQFFDLPIEVASQLQAAARPRSFARGETLFCPEEPSDSLFLIRSGRVKLMLGGNLREDLLIRILGAGDYCGEPALLSP